MEAEQAQVQLQVELLWHYLIRMAEVQVPPYSRPQADLAIQPLRLPPLYFPIL